MRLEGQSKMGYYPTPEVTLSLIPTWLTPQDAEVLRYLDPCCGKGEAIAHVANGHAETFGIELSDARAKEAEDRLARVLNCAYEYVVLADETFSLVLLNPPYDGQEMTGGGKRMEETFLLDCGTTHKLRAGGVLIYIIPHSRINENIARHLAGWYDVLRCFKLPGEEYDAFKQVVIFGKRKESYTAPKGEILSNVLAWKSGQQVSGFAVEEVPLEKDGQPILLDDGQPKTTKVKKPVYAPLPELAAGHGEYEVPPSPLRGKGGAAFRWQYQAVSEDDYLREAEDAAARLDAGREWRDLFPRLEPPTIEPAMTPKRGHIAMQMSGGLLGTNLARDPSGQALLLKGNVTKRRVTEFGDVASDDDDDNGLTKVKIVEQFQTMLSTLSADGEFVTHTDPATIRDLMEKYVEQLASIVQTRNVPQYDMKPEAWEWAVFDNLSKGRRLPGRNETGLTDFQKHLATALGRLCLTHGAGFINAEMGSGKAQPQHAKLLTPDGWRTMGNICVGDKVIGADGNPTKVLGVYPQGEKDIYRVAFTDGSWAECCDDHLWAVQTPLNKWKGKAARVLSLRDVRRLGLAHVNGNLQHFIPIVKPIRFAVRDLPIVPYLLGVLLGDGGLSSSRVMLSSSDEELLSDVAQLLPSDVLLRHVANYDRQITTGKAGGGLKYRANSMFSRLRELGLLGSTSANKFIPETYLLADVAQRTQLLQGLLDTDGYVSPKTCTIEYVTVSPRLADDVSFLVQSLGGTVTRRLKLAPRYWYKGERRTGKMAYRLFLALPNGIQPFRLSRKMDNYRPGTKYHPSRAIKSIEFVGRMPAQCIKVEAGDGLYLTDNCVVTHNTSVGIAIAEYLRVAVERKGKTGAYPALVVGPGIVTGKENWPKEIAEVTPGADSRVLTAGVKPLPKPMKIGDWLKEVVGLTLADDEFEGLNAKRALALVQHTTKKQKKSLSDDTLAALAQSLRHAEANPPDRRKGAKSPNPLDGRIGGFLWLGVSVPRDADHAAEVRGRYSLAQFIAEYQSGALPEKTFAIMSFETAKLQSGRVSAMGSRRAVVTRKDEDGEEYEETAQVCACPHCGSVVAENYDAVTGEPDMATAITAIRAEQFIGTKRRFCKAPVRYFNTFTRRWEAGKRVWDAENGKHVYRALDEDDEQYVCGAPLFEVSSLRRVAAVEYLKRKARSAFGLCLVDEIHKAKAKGTGAGWALSVLGNVTRWTVGLTGTLFGGHSTSIFWLLYRLSPEVRREFGFNDERRWTEKYGLLKREFYTDGGVTDDGAFTGTKFFETVSEKPGISPAIAGVGLKFCTFSSLKDIGLPLPQYSEEIVRLDLTSAMQEQYAKADGSQLDPKDGLFKWAIDEQKRDDGLGKGAISVWLNTALHRPDAMFRPEDVFFNRRYSGRGKWAVRRKEQVTEFGPACNAVLDNDSSQWLGDWLPKELWTAEKCAEERRAGRKTLVYVKQTGTRDVQPRLKAALEAHGLRAGILKPTIKPENRATWMKRHADEFDCLITNAKLVEVGLNLTMFNTAIFFEIEYSLYVVWQGAPSKLYSLKSVATRTIGYLKPIRK